MTPEPDPDPQPDLDTDPGLGLSPDPATDPVSSEVVVIGSGPAGMAAAVGAWRAGARVLLLDADARPGGQYWRHPVGREPDRHHRSGDYRRLAQALRSGVRAGGIDHRAGHRVWRLDRAGDRFDLLALTGSGPAEREVAVTGRAIVLATGTVERALPFPGWDLPGVLTAGAAQTLLAEHGVPAGRRVIVGGTGPFLLPVAAGLAEAGARVLGVLEANDPRGWLPGWRGLAGAAGKLAEGAAYAGRLARHRVPIRPRTAVVAAHGQDRLAAVTIARLDRQWRIRPGTERRVECDAIAIGWGFVPRLELACQLGCPTSSGPDGAPVVAVDLAGGTEVPGVFGAGEITGVGGAELAALEGEVAGRAAARWAGNRGRYPADRGGWLRPPAETSVGGAPLRAGRRRRLQAFAQAMQAAHPIRDGWVSWLDGDTLVCRCEEVSLRQVDQAIELGATDARTAKLLSRCGMGWCQGRVCAEPVARILASRLGPVAQPVPEGLLAAAARPLAVPVRLGTLARDPITAEPSGQEPAEPSGQEPKE